MPSRYAPVPTTSQQDEMNAAFDDSDDEGDDHHGHAEQDRRPLLQTDLRSSSSHPLADGPDSPESPSLDTRRPLVYSAPPPPVPGTYDFEYDYPPPPGSPPPITSWGNTNGSVPAGPVEYQPPRPNVFRRALGALLPTHYSRDQRGGGINNDGVFANISAKPVPPRPVGGNPGSGMHFSPEEVQKEAPPSYQSAQADAVPPYWETTIVTSASPGEDGELIVDQLPTGSLFSFLWNLLVSMSFQFVGFLLTYLLHTTHAAKFGSRAGLGVTLIQYGFYLRSRVDALENGEASQDNIWGWPTENPAPPKPTFATAEDARKYYEALAAAGNVTSSAIDPDLVAQLNATATTANEWLAFFLMTVGWFVLLTSLLGFWRVKRWERGVRRAAHEAANPPPPPTAEEIARDQAIISSIEAAFGIVSNRVQSGADHIRTGLGLPQDWDQSPGEPHFQNYAHTEEDRARFEELTRR